MPVHDVLELGGSEVTSRNLRVRLAAPTQTFKAPLVEVRTYTIEPAEGGESLCHPASPPGVWVADPDALDLLVHPPTPALLVVGELYSAKDARVPRVRLLSRT